MAYENMWAVEAAFVLADKGEAVAPPAAARMFPRIVPSKAPPCSEGRRDRHQVNGTFRNMRQRTPTVKGDLSSDAATAGRSGDDSIEVTINRTAAATTLARAIWPAIRLATYVARECKADQSSRSPPPRVWSGSILG